MNNYESNLNEFISKMRTEQKAESTISRYVFEVKKLIEFAEANNYDSLTSAAIEYKKMLVNKLKAGTINNKITAINAFLAFANESFKLKNEKVQQSNIYNVLTIKEYERICKKLEEFGELQTLAIVRTLAGTGIRFSELESVTVEACRKKQLIIRGKGNKTRKVALMKELASYLLDYAGNKGIKSGMIFATKTGSCISLPQFHRKLKASIGRMRGGLAKEKVHAHAFRHLFALQLLESTNNIATVQQLLGHTSATTTMIYLRQSEAQLKDAVQGLSSVFMKTEKKTNKRK